MANKKRTIEALNKVINEMQNLVNHPRMQQRNWVVKGKTWLPVLQHAKEDLQQETNETVLLMDMYQGVLNAIEAIGLTVEKRDTTSWGYRWYQETLMGTFTTQSEAIEAGLRERKNEERPEL